MSDETEIEAVEKVVRQVWEHFFAQEPDKMLALMHADCTVWDVFQPDLVTKHDMEAYVAGDYEQSAARGSLTVKQSNFLTTVWGDAATCRFNAYHKYEPPGAHEGRGRTTCVLRKFPDEGWLLVHVHEGALPEGIPSLEGS